MLEAVLALALPACVALAAPEYLVDSWQTERGLPQNTVKAILQTRDGYLWVGTYDGLARFDGVQFTVFTVANAPGLGSSDITRLCEDREGRLWIGTVREGLACYQNGEFTPGPGNEVGKARSIQGVVQARDGSLLVLTVDGVFRLKAREWEPIAVPGQDFTRVKAYGYLGQNSAGDVWMQMDEGLYRYADGRMNLRESFDVPIMTLGVDPDGAALCGLQGGRVAEVPVVGPVRYTDFSPARFASCRRTRNGDLWVATEAGLIRIRGGNRLRVRVGDGELSNEITGLFEDREGNLWLGSNGGGLHRLRERIAQVYSTQDGLSGNDASSVIEDREGRIWLGTFGAGVNVLTGDRWKQFPLAADRLREPSIGALCQTRDGAIWLGGQNYPSQRWFNGELERISDQGLESVRAFLEDRDGGLWIGDGEAGLEYRRGEQRRRYDEASGLSRNTVTAIAQDSSGAIWAGSVRGLNRIEAGRVTRFFRQDGLGGDAIYGLYADPAGALWIGTGGGGLSRYQNGRFATLTTDQGLLGNVIGPMIEDDYGYLWMGGTAGISRVRKRVLADAMDGKSRFVDGISFQKTDGLLESECANGFQSACLKARDGRLWFCTIGGAVVFDPKKLRPNQAPPPARIETVTLDERRVIPKSGSGAPVIVVPAGTARVELAYTGLSLTAPEKIRFRYRLEGYDPNWIETGVRRAVSYTHLRPGGYQFHVTAANSEGEWNSSDATLGLQVEAFYWQTAWFRAAAGAALAGVVLGIVWLRVNHARRIQALRVRIAHDLHDDAGSNLGSIRLLSRRAVKLLQRRQEPVAELQEIERISATTAESVRDVVWLISPEFDTLGQLLDEMESRVARLSEEVKFNAQWNVTGRERKLTLEFRTHLFLIFKELIHNIQKHAAATHVEIEMTEAERTLTLRVRDDGVGFEAGKASRGHGLNSLTSRAAQLGGSVKIESQRRHGTTVTIEVVSP